MTVRIFKCLVKQAEDIFEVQVGYTNIHLELQLKTQNSQYWGFRCFSEL